SLPARWQVATALGIVYVVWGSTYLGIRFAVETLPPFLMASARFLVAGAVLYGALRLRGGPRPTAAQWRHAALLGVTLLVFGTGVVGWAETSIPSSLAALLVSSVPLFLALLEWAGDHRRPTLPVAVGLLVGFGGVALLGDPRGFTGEVEPLPVIAILVAAMCWATGSWWSGRTRDRAS